MSNLRFAISIALIVIAGMLSSYIIADNYINEPAPKQETKSETLRDILSKPTPMTSSYEVVDVVNGEYHLVDVALDGNDQGTFILEGNYEVGDVVTVMWATEDSTEISGDVKVGTASELDKQYCKAGCDK